MRERKTGRREGRKEEKKEEKDHGRAYVTERAEARKTEIKASKQ